MVESDIPQSVTEFALTEASQEVPVLNSVRSMPAFAPDGSLRQTSGYDPGLQCYLDLAHPIDVPQYPTDEDVEDAKQLLDEFLHDFPFADQASRTHAIAYGLLPLVRPMIMGATPLHMIMSNAPGSGKGLLGEMFGLIATGRKPDPTPLPREDAEVQKTLTTLLKSGYGIIMLDNIDTKLFVSSLAVALTAYPYWVVRLLGGHQDAHLQVNCVWLATGNDVQMSPDVARRSLAIKIDCQMEQPSRRTGFLHPNLRAWVAQNQQALWRALAILVQNWVAHDMPPGTETMGTYESYSQIMGGILALNDIPGFLANRDEFLTESDTESDDWRSFFLAWEEKYQNQAVSVGELHELAKDRYIPGVLGDKGPLSQSQRLGRALKKAGGGKVYAGLRCTRDRTGRTPLYRLERVEHLQAAQEEMVGSV